MITGITGLLLGLGIGGVFGYLVGYLVGWIDHDEDTPVLHRPTELSNITICATSADGTIIVERALESANEVSWN